MGETSLQDRIKKVVDYSTFSMRKFALECGMKQSTFDKHIRGTAEPNVATIIAIGKRFPEISMEWLLLEEGEMIKNSPEDPNMERVIKLVDTINTLQDALNAKTETITALQERIKQLENQLKTK